MTDTATSSVPQFPDHRSSVFAAQEWVAGLVDQLASDQYALPTPCREFDVRTLLGHLYGVADRLIAMGHGWPAESVPAQVGSLPNDVAGGLRARIDEARNLWADEASLTRLLEVPWGQAPGAMVLGVYLAENVTHGWDLAMATGQDPEADPELAGIALQVMTKALPADGREDFPFDNPVEPAPEAGPTERLANWMGRGRS